jgi:PII-like signaling protein
MTDDYLKLTAYFSERQRIGSKFLADSMLDLMADRRVASSVTLRGIASFGHSHILRSDRSLTLSEDPPITIAAIDTQKVIQDLANDAVGLMTTGTLTLERAQLLTDTAATTSLPHPHDVKLTVYVGRRKVVNGLPAYYAVCDLLHRHHFAGASVFLGVDGTNAGGRCRAKFFGRNTDVPLMIIAAGTTDQARAVLPELSTLVHSRVITVEKVQTCIRDGEMITRPPELPAADAEGRPLWQKLIVHSSEAELTDGVPIHRALVRQLWQSRTAMGATVLRGIWGFYGDHKPHGDAILQFRRQVPVATIIIDTPERIQSIFDIVAAITGRRGLVTSELVPALVPVGDESHSGTTELASYDY